MEKQQMEKIDRLKKLFTSIVVKIFQKVKFEKSNTEVYWKETIFS